MRGKRGGVPHQKAIELWMETLHGLRERMAVQPYPLQKMRFAAAMAYIIAYLFRSFSEGRIGVHD